ncbi:hypothetical protein LPJ61_005139, partial [Coemansia biformis]
MMSEVEVTLTAVHTLKIVMMMEVIREISRVLVSLMPGVTRLEIFIPHDGDMVKSLFGQLTDHYAEQLERFEGNCSVMAKSDGKFKQLQE